jgi:hypothetical protein
MLDMIHNVINFPTHEMNCLASDQRLGSAVDNVIVLSAEVIPRPR